MDTRVFKGFVRNSIGPLLLAAALSFMRSGPSGLTGTILGWSGMTVYLFWVVKTLSLSFAAKNNIMGVHTFFRFVFLFLILRIGAVKGVDCFLWTAGTAVFLYFFWLFFVSRWFYSHP